MKKQKDIASVSDLIANNFNPDQVFQFWLIKKNKDSSYYSDKKGVRQKKSLYPISVPIKLEFSTLWNNPANGKQEQTIIRHCIGEHEVVKNLQTSDEKIAKTVTKLMFTHGHKNIKGNETSILKAISMDDRWLNKPNRDTSVEAVYFLRDDNARMDEVLKKEDLEWEVLSFIRDPENFHRVYAYARVILSASEFSKLSPNPQALLARMRGLAKGNPTLFKQGLLSELTLKKHFMMNAVEEGVLIMDTVNNALRWKNGEMLHQSPVGISPINAFVDRTVEDRSMNSETLYGLILKALGITVKEVEQPKKVVIPNATPKTDDEFEKLFAKGVEKGLITKKGVAGWCWKENTDRQKHFKGKKPMKEAFLTEEVFSIEMKNELQ